MTDDEWAGDGQVTVSYDPSEHAAPDADGGGEGVRPRRRPVVRQGSGHRRAFGRLYREHFGVVWSMVRRCGVPPAHQEDAVQEVWLVVYRRLDTLEPDASARAWLSSITRRVASRLRRTEFRQRRKLAAIELATERPGEGVLEVQDARKLLDALLGQLDDDQRDVLVLAQVHGLTGPEIAQTLEIPVNTAYSRLRLARRRVERFAAEVGVEQASVIGALRRREQPPARAAARVWLVLAPKLGLPIAASVGATTAASAGSATTAASVGSATTAASAGSTATAASAGSATMAASAGSATTAASAGSATTAIPIGGAATALSAGSATTVVPIGGALTVASTGTTAGVVSTLGASMAGLKVFAVTVGIGLAGLTAVRGTLDAQAATSQPTASRVDVAARQRTPATVVTPIQRAAVVAEPDGFVDTEASPVHDDVAPAPRPVVVAAADPEPHTKRPARSRRPSAPSSTPPVEVSAVSSVPQEAALLAKAQRALRAGDAAGALDLLQEHARRFPQGSLRDERRGARVRALCELGRGPQARAEARSLAQDRPDSPVAAGVADVCT